MEEERQKRKANLEIYGWWWSLIEEERQARRRADGVERRRASQAVLEFLKLEGFPETLEERVRTACTTWRENLEIYGWWWSLIEDERLARRRASLTRRRASQALLEFLKIEDSAQTTWAFLEVEEPALTACMTCLFIEALRVWGEPQIWWYIEDEPQWRSAQAGVTTGVTNQR